MEESSAPKPCLEFTTKAQLDNDNFHIRYLKNQIIYLLV